MNISISIVTSICNAVKSLTTESPLDSASKAHLNLARDILENIRFESNIREGLNQSLSQLYSAYTLFNPKKRFWQGDNVLFKKNSYKNEICLLIAIVHYLLNNKQKAKAFLKDNLSEEGWISLPYGINELLGFKDDEEFFNAIFEDNGATYSQKHWAVRCNYEAAISYTERSSFDELPGNY